MPDPVISPICTVSLLSLILSLWYQSLLTLFFCLPCALKPAAFGAVRVFLGCFKTRDLPGDRLGQSLPEQWPEWVGRVHCGHRKRSFPSALLVRPGRREEKGVPQCRLALLNPGQPWGKQDVDHPVRGLWSESGWEARRSGRTHCMVLAQTWRYLGMERGERVLGWKPNR